MTSIPAPNSPPANRYDRQIRIWGDNGQVALQQASVCVINASATATEILKNLVLPGVGSFTIVDGKTIDATDQATNFFLKTPNSTSWIPPPVNRAHVVANSLQALNESVRGSYIPVDASTFLTSLSAALCFVRRFSFIIVTQLSPAHSISRVLGEACAQLKVPLLLARSYGLVAYMRVQLPEHCVWDARTVDAAPDLRLYAPFPELERFAAESGRAIGARGNRDDGFSVDGDGGSDGVDAAHEPFVLILARSVADFRSKHNDKLPRSREERDEFASHVKNSRPSSCPADAQNYEEALRLANLRLCHAFATDIPSPVSAVLREATVKPLSDLNVTDPSLLEQSSGSSLPKTVPLSRHTSHVKTVFADAASLEYDRAHWWLYAKAVAAFVREEGHLPISGKIPDMVADTASYVKVQRIYVDRAANDANAVHAHARQLMKNLDVDNDFLDFDKIARFCKRAREIRLIRSRSIVDELTDPNSSGFAAAAFEEGALDESIANTCASPYYAALRAADSFEKEHGRSPGTESPLRESDIAQMYALVNKVRNDLGVIGEATWRDVTEEVVRFAGVEIHCVAAFIGGMASQEVIKIITGQFVPIADTIVFNLANMTSVTFGA